jgi:hypothetical protein
MLFVKIYTTKPVSRGQKGETGCFGGKSADSFNWAIYITCAPKESMGGVRQGTVVEGSHTPPESAPQCQSLRPNIAGGTTS